MGGRRRNGGYAQTMTREQVDSLLAEDWLRQLVADIRNGHDERKGELPFICPHYASFKNNHRSQADIVPETFTFMTCVDVDDLELVDKAIARAMELNRDEYSDWQDQVLRIAYSARKKVHIYIRIPQGLTIAEAQQAFCSEVEVPYDESCTTPERMIYVTGRDEEVYRSAHWLEPLTEEEQEARREAYLQRGLDVDGRAPSGALSEALSNLPLKGEASSSPSAGGGRGEASPRTLFIVEGVMKEKGLERSDFLDEGGRHTSVKVLLSGATQLLTKAEMNGVLQELMPQHWQDENIQTLVSDFYEKYTKPSQRLMRYQEQLFTQSRRLLNEKDEKGAEPIVSLEMPKKLPKLIQLLTSKTPDIYKAAVAHAVFPPLATHLCEVRFRYTDGKTHEATLMNCLMAGSGAGKSCVDKPIERIMADIERRDKENERREEEWKKDCQKKGANKDKQLRPEGLVIQIIDPDMTKPALVTRMKEAEGHFVYVKLNELDLFEQLKGQTGKQHFQLMCLAFDPDSTYGQTRVGTASVTARPRCRFNWNASTTILKGRRFFQKVLTDGPISRINFSTIPEQEIGAEQPVYGEYDAAFDEALKPYIDNLVAARGLVDCPQAFRLVKKLIQECAETARLNQNQTYWDFTHRACVIAWLKACVLYVANGMKWEKPIEDFIRWSLNYDLWCKMQFFGEAIDRANNGEDSRIGKRGPRNLLELLPDEFTLDDARLVRQQEGLDNDNNRAKKMIRTWMNRGYVIQNTEYSFKKSTQGV